LECDPTLVDPLQPVCPPNFHFDQLDPTKRESLMKRFLSSFARLSRVGFAIGLGLTTFAALGHTAAYAGTVYSISTSLSGTSVQNGWTVAGTIELQDNTVFGTITSSDIKSWSWTATKPGSSISANSLTGYMNFDSYYGAITATATGLYVDSNKDGGLGLADSNFSFNLGWLSAQGFPANFFLIDYNSGYLFQKSPMDFPTDATYGYRFAAPVAVPEPSTYAMALAGLACGGSVVFRRRRAR
jgi:hypothetical protein